MSTKSDKTSSKRHRDEEEGQVKSTKRLVLRTIIYDESKANQWLDDPPLEIWDHHIIPLLGLKDLALSRHVCTFFEAYWQDKFSNNVLPLRVGNDVATIDDVMGVIEILSSRREYTKLNPCVVLLGKGDHQITSTWATERYGEVETTLGITCSNITFLGNGKDTTTILGGFGIENVENITFKNMTVTNTSENGHGIYIKIYMSNAEVELMDVAIKRCDGAGLHIPSTYSTSATTLVATRCEFANNHSGVEVRGSLNSAKFKNCVFHDNFSDGIRGLGSVIHLHGEATAVHSNGRNGIYAFHSRNNNGYSIGKVIIHLPSHHNTSYNNGVEDRYNNGQGITNVED